MTIDADQHRILKSTDPKLPGWRLRISWEEKHEIEIVEEIVHAEKVDNPEARHTRRNAKIIASTDEIRWLRDTLNEWLGDAGPQGERP